MKHVAGKCAHGHRWIPWGGWPPENKASLIFLRCLDCSQEKTMTWREALDYVQLVRP